MQQISFNRDYVWRPTASDLTAYIGQRVRVTRRLSADPTNQGRAETDAEVGPMYRITLNASGKRFDAFADELAAA